MKTNREEIGSILNYIEDHLIDSMLSLDTIAQSASFSKYHLHRMFTSMIGFPVHSYIIRRRLNEASKALIETEDTILDIALRFGYETQRSITKAFRKLYHHTPAQYRKLHCYAPIQLKYDITKESALRGERILDIKICDYHAMQLIGYAKSTRLGFHVIGICWRKLHKHKREIQNRCDCSFLIGVDDYQDFEHQPTHASFTYFAGAEVSSMTKIPHGMTTYSLPPSTYICFTFHGRNEESLQSIVEYIYQVWFPNASVKFNEKNRYDFVKYGETIDANGESDIIYCVPILTQEVHLQR